MFINHFKTGFISYFYLIVTTQRGEEVDSVTQRDQEVDSVAKIGFRLLGFFCEVKEGINLNR